MDLFALIYVPAYVKTGVWPLLSVKLSHQEAKEWLPTTPLNIICNLLIFSNPKMKDRLIGSELNRGCDRLITKEREWVCILVASLSRPSVRENSGKLDARHWCCCCLRCRCWCRVLLPYYEFMVNKRFLLGMKWRHRPVRISNASNVHVPNLKPNLTLPYKKCFNRNENASQIRLRYVCAFKTQRRLSPISTMYNELMTPSIAVKKVWNVPMWIMKLDTWVYLGIIQ